MTLLRDFGPLQQPAQAVGADVDVALVDDDPVIAALVTRVLTRHGYSASWFGDGLEAVAALCRPTASITAKLILLDVSMPGLGGFGVLHYLQRDGVLEHARVIMLTASASEQDVRQAIGLGATGYLTKPLGLHMLLHRINGVLRRPRGPGLDRFSLVDDATAQGLKPHSRA